MRVAAVDIGTNTARLLIADVDGDQIADIRREAHVVGFGVGVDRTGLISDQALDRAMPVLERFARYIAEEGVARSRAVATSAMRDASNRDQVAAAIEARLGMVPDVIDGAEEAALAFTGAARAVESNGAVLVVDPGGGSTEFVLGRGVPGYAMSVDIGSVRLTDRMLSEHPASDAAVAAAAAHAASIMSAIALPEPPDVVVGVAGTFTSLAAIHLRLEEYDRSRVHGAVLDVDAIDRLVAQLARLSVADTEAIPSLDPKRAPVILGGAIVVREAVRVAGMDRVVVSEMDSLDGLALALSRG